MLFFVGGVSAVTSLSVVWWSGSSVDAILMSMPALVYVLGLSGAVHIVNYYRDACREGISGAPERALKHGWWPCTLAAFTTSLGLLSLYQSNIVPIKKFGLFSAIGVMTTLLLLFFYLPSALEIWPPGRKRKEATESGHREGYFARLLEQFYVGVGGWVMRYYGVVLAGCLLALCALAAGLP
ncbi:MAG: MMPL family transporter, partial [bacterium]|nr:MMPL family transporter [bacterium]